MYNLIRFLLRYHLFILFIFLEAFCFYLIYRTSRYHEAEYVNIANNTSGKMFESYKGITDYLYLRKFSDSLVAENARLHAQLKQSLYNDTVIPGSVSDTFPDKFVQVYDYIPAQVIRNTVNQANNIIYLDKGSLHGIDRRMGVISPNGIVGQVIDITDHYAAVMSVLNKNFKVSAKIKKTGDFGNLYWDGNSSTSAKLDDIPKHVRVKVGDTVVTSGYSETYPRDVMIGRVKKIIAEPDKNFLEIQVELGTPFTGLSYVYVVDNLRKSEINELDSLAKVGNNE
jgi:rod shape-determining protein MreC